LSVVALFLYDRPLSALPALWAPTAVALIAWTCRNARRYGICLPDTTFLFNLAILAEEHRRSPSVNLPVQPLVLSVLEQWGAASYVEQVALLRSEGRSLARQPVRLISGIGVRIRQMCGPDTFAIERLLDPAAGAYPGLPARARTALAATLKMSFPLLCALALAGAVTDATVRVLLIPGAAAFAAAAVVHSRTRFRYALLPSLSIAAASGILALMDAGDRAVAAVVLVLAAGILLVAPARRER
jgi:hypothetical protein